MTNVKTVEELEAIYGRPGETSLVKELDRIIPEYAAFIEASPFVALATSRSRRARLLAARRPGRFRSHQDERTLLMPDRRGNNRTDSLQEHRARRSGRAAVPGAGFGHDTACQRPRAYLDRRRARELLRRRRQGAALGDGRRGGGRLLPVRSRHPSLRLWNPARHADPKSLPTPGAILASVSANRIGGETYDREWPERAKKTMW